MKPQTTTAILALAHYQNGAKRHEHALRLLDHALEVQPTDQSLHIARGVTLAHLARWSEARNALLLATTLGTTFAELECHLGEAELISGNMRSGVHRLMKIAKSTADQDSDVYRRAGFVLATFQKVAAGFKPRSTSNP